jgi:hypothetical protein
MKINEEKKELVKEVIKLNRIKRNLNAKILKLIKEDIENWLEKGLGITEIQVLLKKELKRDFEYRSLADWIQRNVKNKTNQAKGGNNVRNEELNKKEKSNSNDKSITKNDENNGNPNPFAFLKK